MQNIRGVLGSEYVCVVKSRRGETAVLVLSYYSLSASVLLEVQAISLPRPSATLSPLLLYFTHAFLFRFPINLCTPSYEPSRHNLPISPTSPP